LNITDVGPLSATAITTAIAELLTGEHPSDCTHEFLGLLLGVIRTAVTPNEAMPDVSIQKAERNLVECRPSRVYLRDDIDAVAVLVDHAGDPSYLTLDPR
jgi:hypothetical protein